MQGKKWTDAKKVAFFLDRVTSSPLPKSRYSNVIKQRDAATSLVSSREGETLP
jgi:hypothetical protein